MQEANGDRVTWSYDEINQLTRERRSGADSYDVTYTYDEVGNRLTKVDGEATTTYSYDAANELETEVRPSARTTYAYDANGNTTLINAAGSRTTYTWDIENHITLAQLPGGGRNTMTYDGDTKRRRTEDSDGLRNVIWDGQNILLETDSGNSTVARYTYRPQAYGELVSQRRSAATAFHHFDALGSSDRLTDASESDVISYRYRAFGEQTVLSGSSLNPFTWVGRVGYYRQPDTSDYWVRARVYRPTIGRWVSRDPLFVRTPVTARARSTGHRNCFTYSGNDPMGARDASGLRKCCKDWPKCKDVAAPEEYRREPRGRARRPNRACDKEELRDYIGGGAKFLEDLPSYVESPYACEWKDEEGYTHFAYVWTTCCIGPKGECSHKHFRCPGFFKASACIRHCVNVHEGGLCPARSVRLGGLSRVS